MCYSKVNKLKGVVGYFSDEFTFLSRHFDNDVKQIMLTIDFLSSNVDLQNLEIVPTFRGITHHPIKLRIPLVKLRNFLTKQK